MNIQLKTRVYGNYKDIMQRFDRELFEALKPKYPIMEIVAFTGSTKGDKVHLRFHSPAKMEWVSHITESGESDDEAYFIDEGVKLPFPLFDWQHKHIVRKITSDSSYIIDDITFNGMNSLFSLILYPVIYVAFFLRKKAYKTFFSTSRKTKK